MKVTNCRLSNTFLTGVYVSLCQPYYLLTRVYWEQNCYNMKLIVNLHIMPKLTHVAFTCYLLISDSIKYTEGDSKSYDQTEFRDNIYFSQ
jgi:hypothetical protein